MLDIKDFNADEKVYRFFELISSVARGSGNTANIAGLLVSFAKERGLYSYRDASDNVIIKKPATAGYESHPALILQSHTDMVLDKTADCTKDLEKEGVEIYRDGDFLRARGTTLGADDGIGVALTLAVLDSKDLPHPAIEAVFTSNEETGLIGATNLDASNLTAKLMINLDSDEEGVFTVGCAGGGRIDIRFDFDKTEETDFFYKLTVSGLKGGHSGAEIHKNRANAIKVLAEALATLPNVKIAEINGGNADNAIPRSAECCFASDTIYKNYPGKEGLFSFITEKYSKIEPDICVKIEKVIKEARVFSVSDSAEIIRYLTETPYGVLEMSGEVDGLVETSANPGIIMSDGNGVTVTTSVRSAKNAKKEELCGKINELSRLRGAKYSLRSPYPAWEYKKDSVLREKMRNVYFDMYKKEPQILIIHAGLECGIFSNKIDGLDCVSMGPDNFDIHTTEERLSISSVNRVWEYLKKVLKEI